MWPANTKVGEIVASDSVKRMDDDGEKKLHAGDTLTVVVQTYDQKATFAELEQILGKQPTEPQAEVFFDSGETQPASQQ